MTTADLSSAMYTSISYHVTKRCTYEQIVSFSAKVPITALLVIINYVLGFQSLPFIPKIRYLKLSQNAIHNLSGLHKLRNAPIEHLILKENPIAFSVEYRKRLVIFLKYFVE